MEKRTIESTSTPGDALKDAESIAMNLRADGHTVRIGEEFFNELGRKAGGYAVDIFIDEAEASQPVAEEAPAPEGSAEETPIVDSEPEDPLASDPAEPAGSVLSRSSRRR